MASSATNFPDWVLLHLPHDSVEVPDHTRDQFVLSGMEMESELLLMTDRHTGEIFNGESFSEVVRCPVSRLVVDVERFADDKNEIMALRGMGAVYTRTAQGMPLRKSINVHERAALLDEFYWPHHHLLSQATMRILNNFKRVLILDAHSFPSKPLPYELDQNPDRPDICIGSDDFHTPVKLREAFLRAFAEDGFRVRLNAPFSGAIVPAVFYLHNPNVCSIMVEVNRGLYMNESNGLPLENFRAVAERIVACSSKAIQAASGKN